MDCRACIEEYDHHCPWTGKCIGKRNVWFFYLWLLFLVLAFVYEIIEFTMYLLPPENQPISQGSGRYHHASQAHDYSVANSTSSRFPTLRSSGGQLKGIDTTYRENKMQKSFCAFGSLRSMIGEDDSVWSIGFFFYDDFD